VPGGITGDEITVLLLGISFCTKVQPLPEVQRLIQPQQKSPMKRNLLFGALVMMAGSLIAADAPKDEVTKAAKALAEKPNYSWNATVVVPEGTQFRPGPTEGKTEKDGFTYVKTSTFNNSTREVVIKGDKGAFTNRDGEWQNPADVQNAEGPGRFAANIVRNTQTPDKQAADLASATQELKKDGDAYVGDLTEAGAKAQMAFGGRRGGGGGGEGPAISNAKGSVKFWVKDGVLSKYEIKVKGNMDFNGNAVDIDRTTTVEIKEIGTTKVEIPEGAKKKISY
jgi:hypothetical protein